jgi:acyl-CoA thioesterase-2
VDANPCCGRRVAPALTAYATDLTLIGTALRPLEGFNHGGNGTLFTSAVTSHTIWFHLSFRTDRCYCFGSTVHCWHTAAASVAGSLVASYAQEALLRFRDAGDPANA